MSKANLHEDFELFSRALIGSKDVDPVYPFIKELLKVYDKFEPEWFIFVYVAFYNLESAIRVCEKIPTREHWDEDMFRFLRDFPVKKFGHERRGTARNVDVQVNMFYEIIDFIKEGCNYNDNEDFRNAISSISNHGGWASFKIAELFEKTLGYKQYKIPDLGLYGRDPNSTDGPVAGLRWLYGRDNDYDASIYSTWNTFGENLAKGWGVDIGEVETSLCKFHKLVTGKYYVGHDIHEFHDLIPVLGSSTYEKIMLSAFEKKIYSRDGQPISLNKNLKSLYLKNRVIYNDFYSDRLEKIDILQIILDTE